MNQLYIGNTRWIRAAFQFPYCNVQRVAAKGLARIFVKDAIFACVPTAQPKSNPGSGMNFTRVKRRRKIRQRFFVVPTCCSAPKPTLVIGFNINLFPEALDLPIPVKIKLPHINRAASFLNLFHAVQAFSHEAKVAFVTGLSFPVPGAFKMS